HLVAHTATQQLVDRHAEGLALDVPKCDVDRRNRTHDGRAGEMVCALQGVPMMLDRAWILAPEIFAALQDRGGAGFEMAPGPGLSQTDQTFVRRHACE